MIPWGGFGGWIIRAKGVGSWKTLNSLESLGGCSNSNVGSLQLFREKTEGGVLLILLLGGNFPDEMRSWGKPRSEVDLPQTPAQSQSSASHPELKSFRQIWISNGGRSTLKKVVGSSVPLSIVRGAWSSSDDCWGTSCWRGANLCPVCLSGIFLFHPQSPPLCLFYGVFVPSYRVRWPYQTFTTVRVREGDKMGFFVTRIVD